MTADDGIITTPEAKDYTKNAYGDVSGAKNNQLG